MDNDTIEGWLVGRRFETWSEAQAQFGNAECVWQSVEGLGRGPAPATWPAGAGHIWGWATHDWFIARRDRHGIIVSHLTDQAPPPNTDAEATTFIRYQTIVWPRSEGRIALSARQALPNDCVVCEVIGAVPLQFLELG